ncbi:hypothetical protein H0N96_00740 [Candidatus Micrarchaeota archaeon]|nr:hypothetical protein [Candidatus Micrarchaeota archaeon]
MTLDLVSFFKDLPLLALISLATAVVIFPLVFIMSFFYDWLSEKYEKTPKILLMLLTTVIGVLAAAIVIYLYLGFTLQEILASAA